MVRSPSAHDAPELATNGVMSRAAQEQDQEDAVLKVWKADLVSIPRLVSGLQGFEATKLQTEVFKTFLLGLMNTSHSESYSYARVPALISLFSWISIRSDRIMTATHKLEQARSFPVRSCLSQCSTFPWNSHGYKRTNKDRCLVQ